MPLFRYHEPKNQEAKIMNLTEEQLAEAKAELAKRDREQRRRYEEECARRNREAEDRFWAGMLTKYPDLDRDTMYDIWSEVDDYYR